MVVLSRSGIGLGGDPRQLGFRIFPSSSCKDEGGWIIGGGISAGVGLCSSLVTEHFVGVVGRMSLI